MSDPAKQDRPLTTKPARLRHRLPVRLRHYWKTLAALVAVMVALIVVFGEARVRPYITSDLVAEAAITNNIPGEGDLFDDGDHQIKVSYNADEYADMMQTFRDEGEKEFIRATITIDGTVIDNVGLRLKGNSTLQSLRGDRGMPDMANMPQNEQRPNGQDQNGPGQNGQDQAPEDGGAGAEADGQPEGNPGQGGAGGAGGNQGMTMTTLSEDEPEKLPWLISFNEFSSGRAYQGHTEITLRPASIGSDTAVNEALALELTAQAGQTTQDYTLTSFSVNNGAAVPRLLVDAPDEGWADELGNGVLYKARAGGSLEYLGDDPTEYEASFNQINSEGAQDLQPVMDLLEFVEKADDQEFATELADHLDVESFAQYLAVQELISNGDAMDGPGNNYYLWYDTDQKRFTVLSWDLNLAFSNMFGGAGRGGAQPGNGQQPPQGTELPEGMQPPEGMELPEGTQPPNGGGTGKAGNEQGGPGGMGSGALKERFLANADFKKLYEQAYTDLYQQLIASGDANATLQSVVDRAEAAGDKNAASVGQSITETLESTKPEPSS